MSNDAEGFGELRLRHVEAFVAVADLGTHAAAGDALGISRSQASRDVRSLERWFGNLPLLDGNTPAGLSPFGERFIGTARSILKAATEARDAVRALVPPSPPPVSGRDVEVP